MVGLAGSICNMLVYCVLNQDQHMVSDLEQSVEKGYIVGPFLQRRLEQPQRLIDSGGISTVCLVLDRSVLWSIRSVTRPAKASHKASYPPPPS